MIIEVNIKRSDGATFAIDGTNWRLPEGALDNWGYVENDITYVENAVGDGDYYASSRVPSTDRTINAIAASTSNSKTLRKKALAFFNPKYNFDVYVTYAGVERHATGQLYKFECPNVRQSAQVEFNATFMFANPFLKSVDDFGKDIAQVLGMVAFPYHCPDYGTNPSGRYNFANEVAISNNGDVETYCKAVIRARGDVVNPKLIVDDKYVRIIDTMVDGDVYTIDFVNRPATVKKNGVNAIGNTDRTSDFTLALSVGSNTIEFDADTGDSLMSVTIYYNELFLGV